MIKKSLAIIWGALTLTGCSQNKQSSTEDSTLVQSTDSIASGNFDVYDFESFKLHVYLTGGQMGDASYIIEGNDSLVTLEQPLFKINAEGSVIRVSTNCDRNIKCTSPESMT